MITAVVIGRFQTPALHPGHLHLFSYAWDKVKWAEPRARILVLLGTSPVLDERNVLPVEIRREMILEVVPHAHISVLPDAPGDDRAWSWFVDDILDEHPEPVLFGSRDCFKDHYLGKYPFHEVPELPGHSASQQRKEMSFKHNEDFRKGIFYAFHHLNKQL